MPRKSDKMQVIEDLLLYESQSIAMGMHDDDNLYSFEEDSSSEHSSSDDNDMSNASDFVWTDIIWNEADERGISEVIQELQSQRYFEDRRHLPKLLGAFDLVLVTYKQTFPDKFRAQLRINPDAFETLVVALEGHPVWHNNSPSAVQMRCDYQIAIALKRFGECGNAASVHKSATFWGVSVGMVNNAIRRTVAAVMGNRDFVKQSVHWPTHGSEVRENAKHQVIELSRGCEALKEGWCMLDGTLFPIYAKPHLHGETMFDRKKNYYLSTQIVNLPDGTIIDYTVGHVGSSTDSTVYKATGLSRTSRKTNGMSYSSQENLLGEIVDIQYIHEWLIIPFSQSECIGNNTAAHDIRFFNLTLSQIRIRNEHAIGYLKGRMQSLKGLRLQINDKKDLHFAMLWIRSCITIHAFAYRLERHDNLEHEPFAVEGVMWERNFMNERREENARPRMGDNTRNNRTRDKEIAKAKAKRAELQRKLILWRKYQGGE